MFNFHKMVKNIIKGGNRWKHMLQEGERRTESSKETKQKEKELIEIVSNNIKQLKETLRIVLQSLLCLIQPSINNISRDDKLISTMVKSTNYAYTEVSQEVIKLYRSCATFIIGSSRSIGLGMALLIFITKSPLKINGSQDSHLSNEIPIETA